MSLRTKAERIEAIRIARAQAFGRKAVEQGLSIAQRRGQYVGRKGAMPAEIAATPFDTFRD
jgi:hypothetical protein